MTLPTASWVLTAAVGVLVGGVALYAEDARLIIYGVAVFLLSYFVGWLDGFVRATSDHINHHR
jgi:hypothetical protein